MAEMNQLHVAIIATDGFEESELAEPKKALEKAGAKVDVLSEKKGEIQGYKHHDKTRLGKRCSGSFMLSSMGSGPNGSSLR